MPQTEEKLSEPAESPARDLETEVKSLFWRARSHDREVALVNMSVNKITKAIWVKNPLRIKW